MKLSIRQMTMADYEEVVAFWRKQEGIGLNDADERASLARYLRRNCGMSFVARDGGKVVGAVLCGHEARRGYLHHLAVAAPHRRRGIGRTLVDRCMGALRKQGIRKCNVFLFADNPEGGQFWKAVGFNERTDLKVMQRHT